MERLDLQAQTLYAELLQRVLSHAIAPSVEKLGRSFVSKKIGKRTYWYLQHRQADGMKQTYLGAETPELLRVIESTREASATLASDINRRKALCAAIRAMGFPSWPKPLIATLETLANAGIFHLGAILVGTPAYVTCLTALGYRSAIGNTLTGDIDLEIERILEGSMPDAQAISVASALDRVKLGFFPVPGLDPRRPSTMFKVRDGDLMVQFLTADTGISDEPVYVEQLGTSAQPMPYMDYLAQAPMKAVLPFDAGILVNVPNAARLAWHKQIISRNRPQHERAKAQKDIEQAADLIVALSSSDFESLEESFVGAYDRGEEWATKLIGGISRLKAQRPEAFEVIRPILQRRSNAKHQTQLLGKSASSDKRLLT
jgi:hypothetical protein